VSAALGAVMGCMAAYVGMAGATSDFTYASTYMSVVILGILATVAFFTTFVKFETPAKIAGKSVFLLASCIIAFVVGMVGAIVVLIILAIILILWIASVVLASGGSGSKKIKAKGGLFESDTELTHDYGNMYRDSSGNRWERDGDTVRKLDD
ncbi:MAG: hypothetical protein K2M76_06770, partial [Muribaculaceae bacterium]|nr:hypothetical protein [Muribaculaceae bacterium]